MILIPDNSFIYFPLHYMYTELHSPCKNVIASKRRTLLPPAPAYIDRGLILRGQRWVGKGCVRD